MKKSSSKHLFLTGLFMASSLLVLVMTMLLVRGIVSMRLTSTVIVVVVLAALIATLVMVSTEALAPRAAAPIGLASIAILNVLFFAVISPWMGIGITVINPPPDNGHFSRRASAGDAWVYHQSADDEAPAFKSEGLTLAKIDSGETWGPTEMKINWSEFESVWLYRWLKREDTSDILWRLYYSPELRAGAQGRLIEVATDPLPSQLMLTVPATVQADDGTTAACELHALMSTWVVVALVAICVLDVAAVFIFISKVRPRRSANPE